MIFEGKAIVKESGNNDNGKFSYEIVNDIKDYNYSKCIIIKYMNPDCALLLKHICVIIAENGSPIAHLAIIAREYHKTVILVDKIIKKIPKKGKIHVSYENEKARIQII